MFYIKCKRVIKMEQENSRKKWCSKLPPIFLDLNDFPLDYKEDNDDQLIVHLWEHL
jgi:hypothetical protein